MFCEQIVTAHLKPDAAGCLRIPGHRCDRYQGSGFWNRPYSAMGDGSFGSDFGQDDLESSWPKQAVINQLSNDMTYASEMLKIAPMMVR